MYTDEPASIEKEDFFQRYQFSKRIASIIANSKNDKSITIGIYGKWGEGKTTVMNFIRQELPDDVVVINFNPWMFSNQEALIRFFFSCMAEALGKSAKTNREQIGEVMKEYGGLISSITEMIGVKFPLEKIGDILKTKSVEEFKERIDNLIIDSGQNIAVFIDDIDRLDVEEIQYVFKLVKLVCDFPRTSYILSFDEEMVASALAPKYGGENKLRGYNYLEKIIQVPLKLPKAGSEALFRYTINLVNAVLDRNGIDINKANSNFFVSIFNSAFLPYFDNPRNSIRYANILSFSLPLLKDEVNITDLLILEGVKIFYPDLYELIKTEGTLFLPMYDVHSTSKDQIKEIISKTIDHYGERRKKVIINLLEELFPRLKAIYSNTHYPESSYVNWTKLKRICAGNYFSRFFSYSVKEGDIPDVQFERFIADLETNNVGEIVENLNGIIKMASPFNLITKLKLVENDLTFIQSKHLAVALSKIAHTFPLEQDLRFATTYSQSAIFIIRLIRNINASERVSVALDVIRSSNALEYAMEILYWMNYSGRDKEVSIFNEDDYTTFKDHIVDRFANQIINDNLFDIISDDNLMQVLTWWANSNNKRESLSSLVTKHLNNRDNYDFALNLLKVFSPTVNTTILGTGESYSFKSRFKKDDYDALIRVVNKDLLNDNLSAHFGWHPNPTNPADFDDHEPKDDKFLVSCFQYFIADSEANNTKEIS